MGLRSPKLLAAAIALALAACLPVPAARAQALPLPYRTGDFGAGGFRDILPAGENGLVNLGGLLAWELGKGRPAHSFDQYDPYENLLYNYKGLTYADLPKYFKDASFGVPPGQIASVENPRDDVAIVRDDLGVAHIYGATRAGAMFGAGYAAAEDKLFVMDLLRHAGRAELSSLAGGAPGNRALDQRQLLNAPYSEAELQQQFDRLPTLYGADGSQLTSDVEAFVDGINLYIDQAKLDPNLMPVEYLAIGQPLGPQPWRPTDLVATASLIGGLLGQGGGDQLAWAQLLEQFQQRFGRTGPELWSDWRERNDPEAPMTVWARSFRYELAPKHLAPGSRVLPDPGSVHFPNVVTAAAGSASGDLAAPPRSTGLERRAGAPQALSAASASPDGSAKAAATAAASGQPLAAGAGTVGGMLAFPPSDSNALLVAARHSASGHPIAVMGPQVGYFNPQVLTSEDIHGPGIDSSGASFAGLNLYVELGRGDDYAWSATSAGQDIIHTFAVRLCNTNGSPASTSSLAYVFRGRCVPMSVLSATNSWSPNLIDSTPPGSETLTVDRTALGTVVARATAGGQPIAYTELRSTYGHELDSALGFSDFNNPTRIHNARDFERAADRIGLTFNWFYLDDRDIAYFDSGFNPVPAQNVDPTLPVAARYEWQGFDPATNVARYTSQSEHPQVINQDFLTSWNNKQARAYSAAGNQYGPVYRSQLLDRRIEAAIVGGRKMTLPQLVSAMEDAATVDLRAESDLGLILTALGRPAAPALRSAVGELRAWLADGAHRVDPGRSGTYLHSDAIAIMDAWWPLLVHDEFEPTLGAALYAALRRQLAIDNPPNNDGDHLGSAYDTGWWGYVNKDLRTLLGKPVAGRFHRVYCGDGRRAGCAAMLRSTLADAIAAARDRARLYADPTCAQAARPADQECFDAISFRPLGALDVPLMPWVNRPTYQQAVEIPAHRPRASGDVYTQPGHRTAP